MKNMEKDTSSRWVIAAGIVVGLVAVILVIIICCFVFDTKPDQTMHVDAVDAEEIYQSDDYMTELTALATALAMPKDVLHRSFTDTWYYVGGILQSDNQQLDKNIISFDRQVLERVLNDIDFWIMSESEFGTVEAYEEEMESAKSITEESLASSTDDELGASYEKYLLRERMENYPTLTSTDFYDNKIVYIFNSTYNRYVISFDIGGSGKIVDYKVIIGQ